MKRGIDVSHHNGTPFDENKASQLIDFFIVRSSYVGYESKEFTVDRQFRNNATLYQNKLRGVYHYYSSERGWMYQAKAFIELVADYDFDFFVVDMERYYNHPDRDYALGAVEFMKKVKDELGIPGIVYTAKYYYQNKLKTYTDAYDALPLWVASYRWYGQDIEYIRQKIANGEGKPSLPVSHPNWIMWQYTSDGEGERYGYRGRMDLNLMVDSFYRSFFEEEDDEEEEPVDPDKQTKQELTVSVLRVMSNFLRDTADSIDQGNWDDLPQFPFDEYEYPE